MPVNDGLEPYTRHICVEHQRLNRLLLEARHHIDAWRATGDSRPPTDVIAELKAIGAELDHHFAEEEAEGCLEEAMCRYPSLAPRANSVVQEHPAILAEFRRLSGMAERGLEQGVSLPEFVAEYERLYNMLQAHEAEESRIIQQAFSASLDTGNEPAVD